MDDERDTGSERLKLNTTRKMQDFGFWPWVGFKIGAVTRYFQVFWGQPVKYAYTWLLEPDQISHTQSMVAKRSRIDQANVHTPIYRNFFVTMYYQNIYLEMRYFTK